MNQTRLNTNELFINHNSIQQHQQPLADASISTPQKILPTSNTKLFPVVNQPTYNYRQHYYHQEQKPPQIQYIQPIYKTHPKVPIYHQPPQQQQHQIPLIYEYHQQQNAPQVNYFHQQQHLPQEVIYHQQPIVSMAELQANPSFLPTAIPIADSFNGNIESQVSQAAEQQQEPSNTNVEVIEPQLNNDGLLQISDANKDGNVVSQN